MAEEEKKDLTEKKDTEKKKKDSSAIRVSIEPSDPKDFIPRLSALQDKSLNMSRMSEQGIISEKTGAAVVVREDGQINLTSGKYSQFKISPLGRTTETSLESVTMTNRKKFNTDEFIINEHKLNPLLWEYTDFKETKLLTNQHAIVGNLCMMGSVLVKAWEPNLKRYVLIRRPWRGPIFGNFMNVPEINPALGVHDPLKLNEDILALSNKGYQVNGVIKDAKTLIGKQGEDRPGINRGKDALSSGGGSSGGGGSSSGGSSSGGGSSWSGDTSKYQASGDNAQFIEYWGSLCQKVFKTKGYDLPVSVCIAQAIHESGWGTSRYVVEDNNFLGIGPGQHFDSPEACAAEWGYFFEPPTYAAYQEGADIWHNSRDVEGFVRAIAPLYCQDGTDYINPVMGYIRGNNLTRFDNY